MKKLKIIKTREPKDNEVLVRAFAITFFAYTEDDQKPIWARYQLIPIPKDTPDLLQNYQLCIGEDKFTVVFEDKGQSEAEAVKAATGIVTGYLAQLQADMVAAMEEYIKCLK